MGKWQSVRRSDIRAVATVRSLFVAVDRLNLVCCSGGRTVTDGHDSHEALLILAGIVTPHYTLFQKWDGFILLKEIFIV